MLPWWRGRIVLGRTGPFPWQRVRLNAQERATHLYIVGKTTMGKSKLLEHLLYQDIAHRRGAAIVDPHGDLAEDLVRYLVARRFGRRQRDAARLVYFDPAREDYCLALNPLDVEPGTDPYEAAQEVVEVFRRIWPISLEEAPVFTDVMLNSLITLMANGLTLLEMPRLLTDSLFRASLLARVTNPTVQEFFLQRFDRWGREQALRIESTLNKVSALAASDRLRAILGQTKGSLRFRELLEEGKALIVNLGGVSEPTGRLLGSLVVVRLYQAALARGADTPREKRRPFYLYIDEFQQFVAQEGGVRTFSQLLSSCAKFGLHLVLAHQTQSQLEERMKGALGNVGTRVAFALDREDAEAMARKLFDVDVDEVKDEPHGAVQHPLYYGLQEQWERHVQSLQNLPPRWAYVRKPLRPAVLMATFPVREQGAREEQVEAVKVLSLRRYGRPTWQVRREIEGRYAQTGFGPGFAGLRRAVYDEPAD